MFEQKTADSATKQLNGYNLEASLDLDYTTGSNTWGADSIVSTKAFFLETTNLLAPSGLDSCNYSLRLFATKESSLSSIIMASLHV